MLCVFLSFFPHTLFPLLSFLSFHSHSLSYSLRDTQQTHPECKKGFSLKKSHLVISCLCDVIWPIMSQANQINEVYQGLTIRPVPLRHRVAIKEARWEWHTRTGPIRPDDSYEGPERLRCQTKRMDGKKNKGSIPQDLKTTRFTLIAVW